MVYARLSASSPKSSDIFRNRPIGFRSTPTLLFFCVDSLLFDEDHNWCLDIGELKKALDEARPYCSPRALVLINPGNPTSKT